ncbi:MAG: hypothetical protein ABSA76_10700, partial [Bacteroidales bacterium]
RSLETVKSIVNFFIKKEDNSYPVLKSICGKVKIYPYVIDAADRIIDKNGNIRDNSSPKLKEIRNEITAKSILVSKRLNAILRQAQAEGFVDSDTVASVRNGRGNTCQFLRQAENERIDTRPASFRQDGVY